eukprot:345686-Chlamydomonas_euryale.AAC.1
MDGGHRGLARSAPRSASRTPRFCVRCTAQGTAPPAPVSPPPGFHPALQGSNNAIHAQVGAIVRRASTHNHPDPIHTHSLPYSPQCLPLALRTPPTHTHSASSSPAIAGLQQWCGGRRAARHVGVWGVRWRARA